jgi:hypothetical protein
MRRGSAARSGSRPEGQAMDLLLVLVVLALIVLLVSAPLRRRGALEAEESADLAEL